MKAIEKLNDVIRKICAILLILMLTLVVVQVFSRRIFNTSVSEIEEISRYCMIWTALLGSGVGVYTKAHVAVDIIVGNLDGGKKKIASYITYLFMAVIFVILLQQGTLLSMQAMTQRSPSMPFLKMGFIMSVVPITGLLGLVNLASLAFMEARSEE